MTLRQAADTRAFRVPLGDRLHRRALRHAMGGAVQLPGGAVRPRLRHPGRRGGAARLAQARDGRTCCMPAMAGVLMHGVYLGGVFWAIHHGLPAGLSALIVGLQPLITAILAGSLLGETHPAAPLGRPCRGLRRRRHRARAEARGDRRRRHLGDAGRLLRRRGRHERRHDLAEALSAPAATSSPAPAGNMPAARW